MPWYYAVAERDHDLQNPTSRAKIRLLGERLRLSGESRVLDVASGKAGPAIVLASEFGCRVVGIERAPEFVAAARERVAAAGLEARIELREADASELAVDADSFDAALCLGASFIWGHIGDAARALLPAVRSAGGIAVGEPFWRRLPLPDGLDDEGYVSLEETVARFEQPGVVLTSLIASSHDDWDTYESLHWRALEEWLAANPTDPDAAEIRARHERNKREYLRYTRELFGWAIFVGRRL